MMASSYYQNLIKRVLEASTTELGNSSAGMGYC